MRILMLTHGYPPTISGVTVVVQNLSRAFVLRGHDVTVVAASDRRTPYVMDDEGVRVSRVRSVPNPYWRENPLPAIRTNRLGDLIREVRPDVIHSHDAAILCRQLLRLQSGLGIPTVMTCHFIPRFVGTYVAFGKQPARWAENTAWSYAIKTLDRFDHVVFPTATQQQFFLERGLRAPSTPISNGLDLSRYHPPNGEDERLETVGDLPSGFRILFVGRIAKDKEIGVLIKAMPNVLARRDACLLIVGRGDDREKLEQLARQLGVSNKVRFLGFVPERELPILYRKSNVFAIASTCEVQSIPTIQAAATGLPIVVADAGALPELVSDGVNGYLVPPGDPEAMSDAIVRAVEDPERVRRFSEASLGISRGHAEEQTYSAYEEVYARVRAADSRQTPVLH